MQSSPSPATYLPSPLPIFAMSDSRYPPLSGQQTFVPPQYAGPPYAGTSYGSGHGQSQRLQTPSSPTYSSVHPHVPSSYPPASGYAIPHHQHPQTDYPQSGAAHVQLRDRPHTLSVMHSSSNPAPPASFYQHTAAAAPAHHSPVMASPHALDASSVYDSASVRINSSRDPSGYYYVPPLSPQDSYGSASQRPFPCDLCALSFNRQHDLKRHRDTHSGERPFVCNGGCGKTFTRKDALKRHQLVKGCGRTDD